MATGVSGVPAPPTVAILPWGEVVEDFLEPIGLDLERFAAEMTGGWLFGYAEALRRVGARAVVVCPSRAVAEPRRLVHSATGTPIWALPPTAAHTRVRRAARGGGPRARLARQVAPWLATPPSALARALWAEDVDVVVCQEHNDARLVLVEALTRRRGLDVWATYQGGTDGPTALERLTHRWALRQCRGLLVGSSGERERLRSFDPAIADRLVDVPNPLDTDAWVPADRAEARRRLGIAPEVGVVSWYGRVERHRKGLDVLAAAWAQLSGGAVGERTLLMTGTGPDRDRVATDLAGLPGVRWDDTYTLDRPALRAQLAACDVAVLPSRHEGFAVTLLEALACGRATVAADVPGVRDVVPRGEQDGCLVVPAGDASSLAEAMRDLLDDAGRRARMGDAGRRRVVEGYGLDAVGHRLLEAFAGAAIADGRAGQMAHDPSPDP